MSSIFACDLGLNQKTLPRNFFCCFNFVFEKFSCTSPGGKWVLRWFYCLEKQKFSLERTPPGKQPHFCVRYLWKMKEKPANLNRGYVFLWSSRPHAKIELIWTRKKIWPKKSLTWFFHTALQLLAILGHILDLLRPTISTLTSFCWFGSIVSKEVFQLFWLKWLTLFHHY